MNTKTASKSNALKLKPFKVKRIEVETIQGQEAKDVYKKCPTWVKLHEQMIEAVKAQKEREEEIRIELRNK